ncbi:MAG: hypothetical protein ABJE95_32770 [Byssovorax sp.]
MASEPEIEPPSAEAPSPRSSDEIPAPGRRYEVLATLAIVGALVVAVAARPLLHRVAAHPSRDQCVKMLDRYAEEEARAADPARGEKGPPLDEAPARTIAATTLDHCTHDLTRDEVDCALRSNGADELERCLLP